MPTSGSKFLSKIYFGPCIINVPKRCPLSCCNMKRGQQKQSRDHKGARLNLKEVSMFENKEISSTKLTGASAAFK